MFKKSKAAADVAAITAQMTQMVVDLGNLAQKREELSAQALKESQALAEQAQADFDEAVKARTVANKISEMVNG